MPGKSLFSYKGLNRVQHTSQYGIASHHLHNSPTFSILISLPFITPDNLHPNPYTSVTRHYLSANVAVSGLFPASLNTLCINRNLPFSKRVFLLINLLEQDTAKEQIKN